MKEPHIRLQSPHRSVIVKTIMTTDRQAFIASIALHGAALGLLAAFIFITPFPPEEQPVVLELVVLPDANPPTPAPAPELPSLVQPEIAETPPRPLPDISIPEPEPAPTPAPAPQPEPVAETPPPPQPRLMSMDDFRRQHDLPDQAKPRVPPRPATPAPRIDTSRVTANLSKLLTVSPAPANATTASPQLIAYQQRLVQAIELRWNKPTSGSGDEWAEARFSVGPDGRISNVRIIRSNGPAVFVDSVKNAITSATSVGPRPAGWSGDMTITFRLR